MSDEYDEEARAFRDGLQQAADAEDFEALEPSTPTRRPRALNWPALTGAAAAVAAIVLIGVFVLPRGGMAAGGAPAAAPAAPEAAPQHGGSSPSLPDVVSPASAPEEGTESTAAAGQPPIAGGLAGPGEPAAGFRWESYRDVVVQVPDSWGYDSAPGPDWCAASDTEPATPSGPFVDIRRGGPTMAILCTSQVPAQRLAMNLQFWPAGSEGPELTSPWTYRTVTLGGVTVAVTTDGSQGSLVEQILDSARQVGTDQNGCSATLPEPSSADLARLDGSSISVCEYEGQDLRASVRLQGKALEAAWRAVLAAPAGGGPDSPSDECLPGSSGGATVVLVMDEDSTRFEYSLCSGNGLADSGVDGGVRTVTADVCRAVFVRPVTITMGFAKAGQVCLAAVNR